MLWLARKRQGKQRKPRTRLLPAAATAAGKKQRVARPGFVGDKTSGHTMSRYIFVYMYVCIYVYLYVNSHVKVMIDELLADWDFPKRKATVQYAGQEFENIGAVVPSSPKRQGSSGVLAEFSLPDLGIVRKRVRSVWWGLVTPAATAPSTAYRPFKALSVELPLFDLLICACRWNMLSACIIQCHT